MKEKNNHGFGFYFCQMGKILSKAKKEKKMTYSYLNTFVEAPMIKYIKIFFQSNQKDKLAATSYMS